MTPPPPVSAGPAISQAITGPGGHGFEYGQPQPLLRGGANKAVVPVHGPGNIGLIAAKPHGVSAEAEVGRLPKELPVGLCIDAVNPAQKVRTHTKAGPSAARHGLDQQVLPLQAGTSRPTCSRRAHPGRDTLRRAGRKTRQVDAVVD